MCIWHPMAERGALRDEHLVAVGGGVALVQLAAARVSLCVRVFMCL
jgi:3-dehydroquinate synthetase